MLRRVIGLCLAGGAAYTLSDALSDHLIYLQALQHVTERVETHERFLDVLGASRRNQMTLGPWYNSSVATSLDGMAASVTIPCKGPLRSSDVNIRCIRASSGFRWTLLYTLSGGQWQPVMMDAIIGMGPGGGLVSMSLLEAAPPPLNVAAGSGHPHLKIANGASEQMKDTA